MRRIALLLLPFALLACQSSAPKAASVDHAWVRLPAVPGRPGAAYFTLHGGPVDDRLMSVSSPMAIRAEMHDMSVEGGIMHMTTLASGLAVPARKDVVFDSGGKHVMLFDISPKAVAGGTIPLKFSLASGEAVDAQAQVIGPGDDEPAAK